VARGHQAQSGADALTAVAEKYSIIESAREVQVHAIEPTPRAQGLLIGYVPDARLAFVTDMWARAARSPTSSTRASPRWSRA
jgi:hypothetical protein